MRGNTFFAADVAQFLRGRRFDIDLLNHTIKRAGNGSPHGGNMRLQARRLGDDADIGVGQFVVFLPNQQIAVPQQLDTVDVVIARVGIRKVSANISQGGRAQQGVAQRMQHHIKAQEEGQWVREAMRAYEAKKRARASQQAA